jgi:outer membrane receptor protein involved in Fe transport
MTGEATLKNFACALALSTGIVWPIAAMAQIATETDATKGQEAQSGAVVAVPDAPPPAPGRLADDIIVTATKRASPLESVPVAVSVVTGETIKNLNITNLSELSRQTPSLSITEGGEQTGVSIRGFSAGLNFGFDPSVGLFIDGIYAGRERQFRGTFLDVSRIEVLRGPQAALFGKNTSAGAVLITTGQPVDRLEFSNRLEWTPRSDRYAYEGVLNVPITDTLATRVAVRVSDEQGFFRNTLTGDREEQQRDVIVRGTALWKPTEQLSVRLKGEYSNYKRTGRAFQVSQVSGLAVGRPLLTTVSQAASTTPTIPFAQGEGPRPIAAAFSDVGAAARLSTYRAYDPKFEFDKNYTVSKQRETAKVHSKNVALEINYDLGPVTLTSVTGYSAYDSDDGRDVDWNPTTFLYQPITQDYKQYSEELRLTSEAGGKFEYLVGLYLLRQEFFVDRQTDVDINLFFGSVGNVDRRYATLARFAQDTNSASIFGQGTLNFSDRLHLTVGGRYSYEKKKISDFLDYARFGTKIPLDPANPADVALLVTARQFAPGLVGQRHANTAERDETNFTPEARLAFDLEGGGLVYASVAKGVRSGGFNSGSVSPTEADLEFGAEKTTGFELGTKLVLFDRRVRVNFAAFYQTFKDLQTSVYTGESFDLRNAGKARSLGLEGDINIRASSRLNLSGGFLLLRSKFIENTNVACNITQQYFGQPGCKRFGVGFVQDLSGARFGPRFNGQAGVNYTLPITDSLELDSYASLTYRGTSRGGNDPDVDQPSTTTIDVGATLGRKDKRWYAGVLVANVTNVQHYFFEFEAPAQIGTRIGALQLPRRVTLRVGANF